MANSYRCYLWVGAWSQRFSLTNFPIRGFNDIVVALTLFANALIIILTIWNDVHRLLKYPFGTSFPFLNYLLIFLVAIMPFTFRLVVETGEVGEIAARLYPSDVVISMIVLAVMFHSFIRHNRGSLLKEMILWGKKSRNFALIVTVVYAASLFLPSEEILPNRPLPPGRMALWLLGWLIAILYSAIYKKEK